MSTQPDTLIGYLIGDEPGAALASSERLHVDALRMILAADETWAEPDAALAGKIGRAVVANAHGGAVAAPLAGARARGRGIRRALPWAAAVAAATVAVVGLNLVRNQGDDARAVEFALTPTELAPGASGQVKITAEQSGLRIELNAPGLPRRDNGQFYEAWLRNAQGELVPIGTFHEGTDVVLWAGVPLEEYPTLTITQEDTDNNQASSGKRVLVGTVEQK